MVKLAYTTDLKSVSARNKGSSPFRATKDKSNPSLDFMRYAHSKGYMEKVVGDYSYTKKRSDPHSPEIKLKGARNGNLQVYETGVGNYEVERTEK